MGLFWKRENVFWGRPKSQGALQGILNKAKKNNPVDFWNQSGIYALYADYHLVYVGQAGQSGIGPRLKGHTKDHLAGRWDSFSWFGICYVKKNEKLSDIPGTRNISTSTILNITEAITTAIAEPPLNKQAGRFGVTVEIYLQKKDDRL